MDIRKNPLRVVPDYVEMHVGDLPSGQRKYIVNQPTRCILHRTAKAEGPRQKQARLFKIWRRSWTRPIVFKIDCAAKKLNSVRLFCERLIVFSTDFRYSSSDVAM